MRVAGHLRMATCALVATLAAACGGSSGGPAGSGNTLASAIDKVASASTLTTTIRLDTTAADLQAAGRAIHNRLSPSTARALAGASLVIETDKTGKGTDLDLRAVEGSATLVELRSVAGTLYVHGDVRAILALLHKSKVFKNLQAETSSMPSFVQAAIRGDWVSLPAAALSSLTQVGGPSSGTSTRGSKVLAELEDIVNRDMTVRPAGTDSRGAHYALTADTAKLTADARSAIADSLPGGSAIGGRIPKDMQHRTVRADAWIKDGALSTLSIDLLQFDSSVKAPAGTTLPLTVTFALSGPSISAPTGAVPVDLTQLGTLVGALTGGGSSR